MKKINLRFQLHENANDIFFIYATLVSARSVCAINECLVWYRVRLGSSKHSKKSQPLAFLNALVCIKAHLIKEGVYDVPEGTFLKMALANYEYNLRTAKQNDDTESLELLEEVCADYAAFELGLLRRQSDLPASIKGYYLTAFGRMEKLRSAQKERKVGA